jgi:catechol 2,3-dioxygenase-like lactoylglutathione lyase family enzyme
LSATGPLKRVTVWVRSADASLALYRDALGLAVLEDKTVSGPAIARMVGLEQATLRIVHLAPEGATQGWVGLYEISGTAPGAPPTLPRPAEFPAYGQATLVFETGQMAEVLSRVRATPGVAFITAPSEYVKPTGTPAAPAGRYSEVIFFDPDGIPVSLMGYAPLD